MYYDLDPARLRAARRALFLTQAELAHLAGLDVGTVRDLEGHGCVRKHGARGATVRVVAETLGVAPASLLRVAAPRLVREDEAAS